MKMCQRMQVNTYILFNLSLDTDRWKASHPGRLIIVERVCDAYLMEGWAGIAQSV
jgi:hypothetical protein